MNKKLLAIGIIGMFLLTVFATYPGNSIKINTKESNQHCSTTDEYNFVFGTTNTPPSPVRQPAEFEPMEGVLISYGPSNGFNLPLGLVKEMSEEVKVIIYVPKDSYDYEPEVKDKLTEANINLDQCRFITYACISFYPPPYTRDDGPWFVFDNNNFCVIDFLRGSSPYNLSTLYANDQGLPISQMPIHHIGGNYMTDGQGTAISSNLLLNDNIIYGITKSTIYNALDSYLGIKKNHIVSNGGPLLNHIDCWAKFLTPDTIMIREVPIGPKYARLERLVDFFESQQSCYGTPYKIVRVYTPKNEPYTNSLILNNKIFVPLMGTPWDDNAIASYKSAMPGYEVYGFNSSELTNGWFESDAIHCRTMGIPDQHMLYINHTPLSGNQWYSDEGFEIQAEIILYGREQIIPDSTIVNFNWSTDGNNWTTVPMETTDDGYYEAVIPSQENGTTVQYYIHAEDNSGRSENHPYIGASMAHSFTVSKKGKSEIMPIFYSLQGFLECHPRILQILQHFLLKL